MSLKNIDFGAHIKFEVKKRFGIITLNRPERGNALTLPMLQDLRRALLFCQDNEKIHGIMLTGEGNSFTTGMDIDSIDANNHDMGMDYERTAAEIADIIFNGKPSICAINGKAMGDGVAYSLCSDFRMATEDCYFQMPEILISVFPGGRTVALMAKIIGIPWTKKILMFAEKVDSETAKRIGLIDEIVKSKEDLMDRALQKAKFLSTKNQMVLNLIKLSSNHFLDKSYSQAYDLEKEALINWMDANSTEEFINTFRRKVI